MGKFRLSIVSARENELRLWCRQIFELLKINERTHNSVLTDICYLYCVLNFRDCEKIQIRLSKNFLRVRSPCARRLSHMGTAVPQWSFKLRGGAPARENFCLTRSVPFGRCRRGSVKVTRRIFPSTVFGKFFEKISRSTPCRKQPIA